jgi:hypothetical protein
MRQATGMKVKLLHSDLQSGKIPQKRISPGLESGRPRSAIGYQAPLYSRIAQDISKEAGSLYVINAKKARPNVPLQQPSEAANQAPGKS